MSFLEMMGFEENLGYFLYILGIEKCMRYFVETGFVG